MNEYMPQKIEQKWQEIWEEKKLHKAEIDYNKPKYYVLEMFPYPSGKMHMGHVRNYTLGDVVARSKRMQGYNVLHPMGWDAFGLPAENAAIEGNTHPAIWTYQNIENMKKQFNKIGFTYDWDRELASCSVDYYSKEQKIFLDFYKNDLIYRKEAEVNWDPVDMTVLANEQVVDGRGWRSGAIVEKRKLKQWFLKITEFADDLLKSLKILPNWPDHVKLMQEKWIGRNELISLTFNLINPLENHINIEVHTTVPEAIFGCSFLAIATDHPISLKLAETDKEIKNFIDECKKTSTKEAEIEKLEKIGFKTNLKVSHPLLSGKEFPVYIANYVLNDFGAGAVYGAPHLDQRDNEFAIKYNINIPQITDENSKFINSNFLDGLEKQSANEKIIDYILNNDLGHKVINYRLRDWGVSRQRYWGCPIPIIHCNDCGIVPVPESDLPVKLPEDVKFEKPGNPLEYHPTWKNVKCPSCGKSACRETDTLDTFFESSWYFARFCDNKITTPINKEACDYWMPVDQYIGGVEHAVLHLLYARFFTKALKKCGYWDLSEPFSGLMTQGMVCHATFKDVNGKWLYPEEVYNENAKYKHKITHQEVTIGRIEKMSKSKKNVVDPEVIISKYGADTARMFMLSDSPPEKDLIWNEQAVEGSYRFLKKLYNFVENFILIKSHEKNNYIIDELNEQLKSVLKITHKSIKLITEDINTFSFNKMIARIREWSNELFLINFDNLSINDKYALEDIIISLTKILSLAAPHIAEELYYKLTDGKLILNSSWPTFDESLIKEDKMILAIQVNSKVRANLEINIGTDNKTIENMALELEQVKKFMEGKPVKKIIIVSKIVNIVC